MWQEFKSWLSTPYRDDMSVLGWFAFFGMLIVIAVLWGLVLKTMKETIA